MAYQKQTWVDHFVDDSGTVVQQGTAMDAVHFNHIEDGVYVANEHADMKTNPHSVTPAQLGFSATLCLDDDGYLCIKMVEAEAAAENAVVEDSQNE